MEKLWYMGVIARTNGACRCDLMYWTWKSRWVIMVFSKRLNYSQKATFANSKAYIWAYMAVFNYLYLFFVSRNTAYPALQMQSLLQIFHNALLLLNMLSLSHNVPGCYFIWRLLAINEASALISLLQSVFLLLYRIHIFVCRLYNIMIFPCR